MERHAEARSSNARRAAWDRLSLRGVGNVFVAEQARPIVHKLLASGRAEELIDAADLYVLAFALADSPRVLTASHAVEVLRESGLPAPQDSGRLKARLCEAAAADRRFIQYSEASFCLDLRLDQFSRLRAALDRALRPAAAPATTPKARSEAPTRQDRQDASHPISPPTSLPAPKPRAAATFIRPSSPAPSRRRELPQKAKPAAPQPTIPAAAPPALPPAPPLARAAATCAIFTDADVDEHLRAAPSPADGLTRVRHVLAAHRLASAEQFEELLSFASLTDVEPHRYQIETVRRVLRSFRGRALLADEVGLGKTIEALIILREYQLRGMVRRALVLVPPALVRQWSGEIAAKTGIEARSTEDLDFRDDPAAFWAAPGLTVASYGTARMPKHAPLVQASPWDLVIVDEAHHLKNRSTSTFKLVDGIKSRFLLMLTATPIETDLEELYNLVTLLKPGQFATPAAFRARFVDPKDPLSLKNRDKLRELLAEVMVRNTRADSGLSLPPRYVTTVAVEPLPEEAALYERIVLFLRDHGAEAGVRMLATTLLLMAGSSTTAVSGSLARALTSEKRTPEVRGALVDLAKHAGKVRASRKTAALVDLARAHGERLLVFTRFRDTLDHVAEALREAGLEALRFHGGQTASEKAQSLAAFREGKRVLIATDVGGEGQNLHHCHTLVNFDLPYNPMLLEQRIGRLHRMGQTSEVRVYNLCSHGTAEERVLDLLDKRLHLFELVVGELDMVLGNLADERDLEDRILALYAESRGAEDLDRGFDAIEAELRRAKGKYDQVKTLDAALFGRDFEA